jgi:hypothetical protein
MKKRLNERSIIKEMNQVLSVVVHKEKKLYVAECPGGRDGVSRRNNKGFDSKSARGDWTLFGENSVTKKLQAFCFVFLR